MPRGSPDRTDRGANLAKDEGIEEATRKLYKAVERGFNDQAQRANDLAHCWAAYRCELGSRQQFRATRNQLYAPFILQAVTARVTRFTNQLFPQSERHVEASSEDNLIPRAGISILEHYIDDTDLREICQQLFVSGDVEGQFNVYCGWEEGNRRTISRQMSPVEAAPGVEIPDEEVEELTEEDEPLGGPRLEVLPDTDICILPATVTSLDAALLAGGSVTILRRWNERQIKMAIKEGLIDEEAGEDLIEDLKSFSRDEAGGRRDAAKAAANSAGIRKDGRGDFCQVYETWSELEIEEDEYRLCQMFFAGPDRVLMVRRNPNWCDRCSLFSAPVRQVAGAAKGIPQIEPVLQLQYFANDVINQGADSCAYTLNPICFRDPAFATSPVVQAPGAIVDVPPNQIQFSQLPPLWQEVMEILGSIKNEIFQALSVNPAMVTMAAGKKKLSQAEVAQEQQIDMLTTADAVRTMKDNILEPLINFMMELDYQYRKHDLVVRAYGEMGMEANLQQVAPFQSKKRVSYIWIGDELIRGQQQVQQKIAGLNILGRAGMPPGSHYQFDPEPILVDLVESLYGPRLGRKALKDTRQLMSVDPNMENRLMQLGHYTPVHPQDNIQEHIPVHQQDLQINGDPFGLKTAHILEHKATTQALQQQQIAAQSPQGGGGGGPQPMQPGQPQPKPGAQPAPPHPMQQHPGMIPPEQMPRSDPSVMPRRF